MASEQLRPLLRTVREIEPFGPKGYGTMTPDHQEQVFGQLEDVKIGFEEDMGRRLAQGFPEFGPEIRSKILEDTSLLAVAYSAGLSNGELPTSRLVSMAALTAITGVANRLIDRGDPLMREATMRWCTNVGENVLPEKEDARLEFMRGMEGIIDATLLPEDRPVTLSVMRELMAANVDNHVLTMRWKKARELGREPEAAFWDEHTDEVARNLLVTGAVPSATVPLNAMYRQQHKRLPAVHEVWHHPSTQELIVAANADIRVHDDLGDRLRDAHPQTESINLFNLAASVAGKRLIGRFCIQAGVKDQRTIEKLLPAFASVGVDNGAKEAMLLISRTFEQNIYEAQKSLPATYDVQATLAIRALAAGRANTIGDDALVESV